MAGYYRYFVILLAFTGIVVTYMLRVNMSVALICMVNHTAMSIEANAKKAAMNVTGMAKTHQSNASVCGGNDQGNGADMDKDGEFLWDQKTRALILSAFYYGYVLTQLPGGWLAYRFGGKWVFTVGILSTSIFTLATPFSVRLRLALLILLRVLEGVGEGVVFPCLHSLYSQWIPPAERSRLPGFTYAAQGVGTVVGFSLAARLCGTSVGWPLVFYVYGVVAIIWVCLWVAFGSSDPASSRWISDSEKAFIEDSLAVTVAKEHPGFHTVPWRQIFLTPSMWAIWISHTSACYGYFTLLTLLPTYFSDVLHMKMVKNGIYSALPYLCFSVMAVSAGPICDYVLKKKWASVATVRKVADSLGHAVPGVFLLVATAIGCNVTAAVVVMCIAVGTEGLVGVGSKANNLDIAGRFAGITHGISTTFCSITGFIAPLVAGAITNGDTSVERWRIVFGIAAAIYWVSTILYLIMAKGEPAEWAKVHNDIPDRSPSKLQSWSHDGTAEISKPTPATGKMPHSNVVAAPRTLGPSEFAPPDAPVTSHL